jgi:hypothetical protein
LDFFSSRKKKGGFFFTEKTPKTYGVHPGRRRAYLPSRVDFWDAEERVGCGIAGSTSLCRKMEKEVKGWAKKTGAPPGFEPGPEIMYFKVCVEVIPNSTELHQSSI